MRYNRTEVIMEKTIETFNNNLGSTNGARLIEVFWKDCQSEIYEVENRSYHIGLQSLYDRDSKDTKYINGELAVAEGLSARLLMFG